MSICASEDRRMCRKHQVSTGDRLQLDCTMPGRGLGRDRRHEDRDRGGLDQPHLDSADVPIPEGATSSQLDGIDCIWSNVCVAAGRYSSAGSAVKELAMTWNGTPPGRFRPWPNPKGPWKASSSTSPARPHRPAAPRWGAGRTAKANSSRSHIATTARPGRCRARQTLPAAPKAFSKTSPARAKPPAWRPAARKTPKERPGPWPRSGTGPAWSIQGTPNPSGAEFSSLSSVSCRSTICVGVGWSTDGSGVDTTLGEMRE